MLTMLNKIYQKSCQPVKSYLPNPYPAHKIVMKKNSVKHVMEIKGWKTYADMGSALGFTRQYISMIADGSISVSAEFISRMAICLGSVNGNWHSIYAIVPRGDYDKNHPTWNKQKEEGIIPYDSYSLMAEHRKKDYAVEKESKIS